MKITYDNFIAEGPSVPRSSYGIVMNDRTYYKLY